MPDWVVILSIALGTLLASAFVYGMVLGHKEKSQVRDYLIEKYGLSDKTPGTTDRNSKEGDLHFLDERFIGKCSVSLDGIVFLQYGIRRDNSLLFSWDAVESFSISPDSASATFTPPRGTGLPHTVQVPWSPELSLAKEQVAQ